MQKQRKTLLTKTGPFVVRDESSHADSEGTMMIRDDERLLGIQNGPIALH